MDIYRQHLLDHYHSPRNWGLAPTYHYQHTQHNPLCGDQITIQINFEDNHCTHMRITGHGCVISIAAASLLSEHVVGKSKDALHQLTSATIEQLLTIKLTPARVSCATLALTALHQALAVAA